VKAGLLRIILDTFGPVPVAANLVHGASSGTPQDAPLLGDAPDADVQARSTTGPATSF